MYVKELVEWKFIMDTFYQVLMCTPDIAYASENVLH